MLKDGQLVLGEFDLPVCMEQLPHSYSMLSPEVCTTNKTFALQLISLACFKIENHSSI